jgi:hypothetical protein
MKNASSMRITDFPAKWIARQMLKVRKGEDCWQWTGGHIRSGYARATFRGRTIYVHRLMYVVFRGPIPAKMVMDHLCNNRKCVNPKHLKVTTSRDNLFRSPLTVASINAQKTECPKCGSAYITHRGRASNGKMYTMRHCRPCALGRMRANAAKRRYEARKAINIVLAA